MTESMITNIHEVYLWALGAFVVWMAGWSAVDAWQRNRKQFWEIVEMVSVVAVAVSMVMFTFFGKEILRWVFL